MKKTLGFCDFCDEFGGERKNQFTYNGKHALFDLLVELEESTGEEIECDIIAFCCEYSETNLEDWNDENEDEQFQSTEDLVEHLSSLSGLVKEYDGAIVYQDY